MPPNTPKSRARWRSVDAAAGRLDSARAGLAETAALHRDAIAEVRDAVLIADELKAALTELLADVDKSGAAEAAYREAWDRFAEGVTK